MRSVPWRVAPQTTVTVLPGVATTLRITKA